MPDVSVVIVSRDVRELLRACLVSIAAHAGMMTEVIVVDNGSSDGTPAMVRAEFPYVAVIEAANEGFARGNNCGIRRARGRAVLLLNPDTELTPGALPALVAALGAALDIGIVGPRLVYPDGTTQSSRRRFPTLAAALTESTLLEEWRPDAAPIRRYRMDDVPDTAPHDADWLVGACLLVRREVITTVGGLDGRLFLYNEEPEWCWRVQRAGWRVRYVSGAVVRHHEGTATGQNIALRQRNFVASRVYLMGRLHGPGASTVTRAGLAADQTARLLREGAKWLIGHKRPLRAARIAAAAATLRILVLPWERTL